MCQEVKVKGIKVVTLFPSKAKKGDLGFLMRTPKILRFLRFYGMVFLENWIPRTLQMEQSD
jgi:hypothetical protein